MQILARFIAYFGVLTLLRSVHFLDELEKIGIFFFSIALYDIFHIEERMISSTNHIP